MNATILGDAVELGPSDWQVLIDNVVLAEKNLRELHHRIVAGESITVDAALATCLTHLDNISVTAAEWHLNGLVRLCRELHVYTSSLASDDISQLRSWLRTLVAWCMDVLAYMEDPENHFLAARLLVPLPEELQLQLQADLGLEYWSVDSNDRDEIPELDGGIASIPMDMEASDARLNEDLKSKWPVAAEQFNWESTSEALPESQRDVEPLINLLQSTCGDLDEYSAILQSTENREDLRDGQQTCILMIDDISGAACAAGFDDLKPVCDQIKADFKTPAGGLDSIRQMSLQLRSWCDLAAEYISAQNLEDLPAWHWPASGTAGQEANVLPFQVKEEALALSSMQSPSSLQTEMSESSENADDNGASFALELDADNSEPEVLEASALQHEDNIDPLGELIPEKDLSGAQQGDNAAAEWHQDHIDEYAGDLTTEQALEGHDSAGEVVEREGFSTISEHGEKDIDGLDGEQAFVSQDDVEDMVSLSAFDEADHWPNGEPTSPDEGSPFLLEDMAALAAADEAAVWLNNDESDALDDKAASLLEEDVEEMPEPVLSEESSCWPEEETAGLDTESPSLLEADDAEFATLAVTEDTDGLPGETADIPAAALDPLLEANTDDSLQLTDDNAAACSDFELDSCGEGTDALQAGDKENDAHTDESPAVAEDISDVVNEVMIPPDEVPEAAEDFDLSEFFNDAGGEGDGTFAEIGIIDDDFDLEENDPDMALLENPESEGGSDVDLDELMADSDEHSEFNFAAAEAMDYEDGETENLLDSDDDFDFSPDLEQGDDGSFDADNILDVLRLELLDVGAQLSALETIITSEENGAQLQESVNNYIELIERLMAASESLGLDGLYEICNFIIDNISHSASLQQDARQRMSGVLEKWSALVLAYLQEPEDDSGCVMLINHLQDNHWPHPISGEKGRDLYVMLSKGLGDADEQQIKDERQQTATPDDVELQISEDSSQDLIDAFFYEAPGQAERFSECISLIAGGEDVAENVKQAQRIAHTLKGSANLIGVRGLANLTHHIEDILEYISNHHMTPPASLSAIMIEAGDCIEIMIEALQGKGPAPQNALPLLQSVLDWANRVDKGQLRKADMNGEDAMPEPVLADTDGEGADAAPAAGADGAAAKSQAAEMLRVPTHTVDEMIGLLGEVSIAIGQVQEHINRLLNRGKSMNLLDNVIQQRRFDLENLVDVRSMSGMQKRMRRLGGVETESFDPLEMDQYDELYGTAHSYIEAVADSREMTQSLQVELSTLEGLFVQQQRLNKELQQMVMTTRMIRVSSIESRLHRAVRQACRVTGKKVELHIEGSDLLMDSDVLSKLADPLMHMLRNAVDHGIEDKDQRLANGKSEIGNIQLSFLQQGNSVVCRCLDDGKGLDYAKIRDTAVRKGLMLENDNMDDRELGRMILVPGFSTRDSATQISGRGVGMDVVHATILDLKGTLDIEAGENGGTLFTMSLPISLVTSHSLVVRLGEERFAIPTNTLTQILPPDTGEVSKVGDEMAFRMGRDIYPARSLAALINMTNADRTIDSQHIILLVRAETGHVAVTVDQLINSFELVIKSTGHYVENVRGVSGVAVLGDGSVVPVLDIPQLLRSTAGTGVSSHGAASTGNGADAVVGVADVLIVDDSLSVRKSLSQFVRDAGFNPIVARDGLEAVDILRKQKPSIVLVDMEMPRMNGLELTRHIRATPEVQDLPVIMITSRTQQKHRQQAEQAGVNEYLAKPYSEDDLLAAMEALMVAAG